MPVQLEAIAWQIRHEVELLPPLYSPELIALGNDAMLLRGVESSAGVGYVQEWRCVIE